MNLYFFSSAKTYFFIPNKIFQMISTYFNYLLKFQKLADKEKFTLISVKIVAIIFVVVKK